MNPTLILIAVLCSLIIAYCGRRRRLGFWGFFFASLLLTPFMGLLLFIVAGPPKPAAAQ